MKPGPKPIDPTIRFWRKVQRGADSECWLWTGGRQGKGYGQFYVAKREPIGAHRYSWMLVNGPIPPGKFIMHTCDNPPCVNPLHLRLGTVKDNNLDKTQKGRNPGNRTRRGGRPAKYSAAVIQALRDEDYQYREIGEILGISGATAWRTLHRG